MKKPNAEIVGQERNGSLVMNALPENRFQILCKCGNVYSRGRTYVLYRLAKASRLSLYCAECTSKLRSEGGKNGQLLTLKPAKELAQ